MAKINSVLNTLLSGKELTASQIEGWFGVRNPTATISDIRERGYAVYANPRRNADGERKTYYRIGKPTREMVRLGILALRGNISVAA